MGVGPLRSEKVAEFMCTKVPGVYIPDEIVTRLRQTPKNRQREEGKRICVEIIQQVREIVGWRAYISWPTGKRNWWLKLCTKPGCCLGLCRRVWHPHP